MRYASPDATQAGRTAILMEVISVRNSLVCGLLSLAVPAACGTCLCHALAEIHDLRLRKELMGADHPSLPSGPPESGNRESEAFESAQSQAAQKLVGVWVQDDTGPVLTTRRRYRFKKDGTYEFVFTSRNTGSDREKVLVKEEGTYRVEGRNLKLSPKKGRPKTYPWRIEKDPQVGDVRLVFELPDGVLDVYYRDSGGRS